MITVSVEEAAREFPALLNDAINGQEIVITRDDRPVVKLVSEQAGKPRRQFGSARGLIAIAPDFDAPLADFAEYV